MTNNHYGLYGKKVLILVKSQKDEIKFTNLSGLKHYMSIDRIISMYNLQKQIYQITNTSLTFNIIYSNNYNIIIQFVFSTFNSGNIIKNYYYK